MKYVAILGAGVVGSGVAAALCCDVGFSDAASGETIAVKYVLDIADQPTAPYAHLMIKDFATIIDDDDVGIVVETIGGVGAAYGFTKQSLAAGKHVVTSNKELVAVHGAELLRLAHDNGVCYLFEAAVGGGMPIIRPLVHCLAANDIDEIYGVLNGTTNYILTRMIDGGVGLDTALKEAQALGYAEQNPAADIEGYDTQRKISILASLVEGRYFPPDMIQREGIIGMTLDDVHYAAAEGYDIKLLGRYKTLPSGNAAAFVAPHLVKKSNIAARVEGVFNCVVAHGNLVGEVAFYGQGAGKKPTASAIVADILDTIRSADRSKNVQLWSQNGCDFIVPAEEIVDRHYVRADRGLTNAQEIFGKIRVISGEDGGAAVFITQPLDGYEFGKMLERFKAHALVYAAYRVLTEEVTP